MDASSRRPKRPVDYHSAATSPSSEWIRSIQNQSFQPKPTAYSPHSEDEDPLILQQRQCRDKLRALRQVRERIKFYPQQPLDKRRSGDSYSMKISTSMILSSVDWSDESDGPSKNADQN
ncbi:F-box protein [Phytophthora palmivora]|uniref:F-box protein n=1 Tax=Phytophthora palmivora TaxID=4796 RepID=A0A2P4X0U2_9STRA|nr:F-box protein [Phytophthora palmivora]